MRLVVIRRIPLAPVDRLFDTSVLLSELGTGIGITHPTVQLPIRLAYHKLHTVGPSFRIDHIRLDMMIHDQVRPVTVIQIIIHGFIIALHGSFQSGPNEILIKPDSHLRTGLRLDIRIAKFPSIRGRHDRGIGQLMDILPHRIVTGLDRESVCELIASGDPELRSLVSLINSTPFLLRIYHGRRRRHLIRFIQIISSRPHYIIHTITDSSVYR